MIRISPGSNSKRIVKRFPGGTQPPWNWFGFQGVLVPLCVGLSSVIRWTVDTSEPVKQSTVRIPHKRSGCVGLRVRIPDPLLTAELLGRMRKSPPR